MLGLIATLMVIATGALTGFAFWWKGKARDLRSTAEIRRQNDRPDEEASRRPEPNDAAKHSEPASPEVVPPDPLAPPTPSIPSPAAPPTPTVPSPTAPTPTPTPPEAPPTTDMTGAAASSHGNPAAPAPATMARPFDDIRRQDSCLKIPPLAQVRGKRFELAKIQVDKPADCALTLHAPRELIPSPARLEINERDEANKRSWQVTWLASPGVREGLVICTLILENQTLSCECSATTLPSAADLWRWSLLEFRASGDTEMTRVRPIEEVALAPWSWRAGRATIHLPFALGTLTAHPGLRLKIVPAELQNAQLSPPQPMAMTETATLDWSDATLTFDGQTTPLSIRIQPKWTNGELKLELVCHCDLPHVKIELPNLRETRRSNDPRITSQKALGARKVADLADATKAAREASDRVKKFRSDVAQRAVTAKSQLENLERSSRSTSDAVALDVARRTHVTYDGALRQVDTIQQDLDDWTGWIEALESTYKHLQKPGSLQFELVTAVGGNDVTLYRAVSARRP